MTIVGEGLGFTAKVKKRNQITVDSLVVEAMNIQEGDTIQLVLVSKIGVKE